MERSEFEQSALEHLDAVYRMAYHLAGQNDEAEELVQEVYVRAFRPKTIERFTDMGDAQGVGGMRSWLFAICHNVFYSRLKKKSRQPTAVEEFFGEAANTQAPDEAQSAWSQAELDWEHVDDTLRDAITALKPEYREVLMMWGVDGLKYREIAEIIDVPIGTVMSRLHRARKLLMDTLSGDEQAVERLGIRAAPNHASNNTSDHTQGHTPARDD